MIASAVAWLVAKGISPKLAKPLLFAALAVLLLLALFGAKCAYDRSVIDKHEAKIEAATAKADRKADQKAADQRLEDASRLTQEATELKKVQDNAETDADRRVAKHRCLGLQQAARREGKPPPRC